MYLIDFKDGSKAEGSLPLRCGTATLGGDAPTLAIPGLGKARLELEVTPEAVVITPLTEGCILRGKALSTGVRTLWRHGNELKVDGVSLTLGQDIEAFANSTSAMARGALASILDGSGSVPVPTLVWLCGADCGKRYALLDEAVFLGRGEGAMARIRDAQASRVHARLVVKEGRATLHDERSGNGTFVDGARIEEPKRLYGGEVIQIGDTELMFDARLERDPEPVKEPEPSPVAVAPLRPKRRQFTLLEVLMLASGTAVATAGLVAVWLLAR